MKVNLDASLVNKFADQDGQVTKPEFVKLGIEMKLLEFGGAMGEKRKPQTPKKGKRRKERTDNNEKVCMLLNFIQS